jgi:hypothetical protein
VNGPFSEVVDISLGALEGIGIEWITMKVRVPGNRDAPITRPERFKFENSVTGNTCRKALCRNDFTPDNAKVRYGRCAIRMRISPVYKPILDDEVNRTRLTVSLLQADDHSSFDM